MGITINNRLRKAMTAFLFWERDGDGSMAELATALYDLAGDYQALLADYRLLLEGIDHCGLENILGAWLFADEGCEPE